MQVNVMDVIVTLPFAFGLFASRQVFANEKTQQIQLTKTHKVNQNS